MVAIYSIVEERFASAHPKVILVEPLPNEECS